ncbi:MAG: hypothetical protein AAF487_07895 [Bacteroidota bacterium]
MRKHQRNQILSWSVALLSFIYILACFGLSKRSEGIFVFLSVPTIAVTAGVLLINHFGEKEKVIAHFFIFSILLFAVEVLFIHFEIFKKEYANELLGTSVFGVPVIIGISRWMSVYIAVHLVKKLKINRLKKALIGAALLIFVAWLAEVVGIRLKLWQYEGNPSIGFNPINLLGLFVVYFVGIMLSRSIRFKKKNPAVIYVYIIFILFFISLSLILEN